MKNSASFAHSGKRITQAGCDSILAIAFILFVFSSTFIYGQDPNPTGIMAWKHCVQLGGGGVQVQWGFDATDADGISQYQVLIDNVIVENISYSYPEPVQINKNGTKDYPGCTNHTVLIRVRDKLGNWVEHDPPVDCGCGGVIPTLTEWALIILGISLLGTGTLYLVRKNS